MQFDSLAAAGPGPMPEAHAQAPQHPPVSLSPSRASDFKACPQLYKFRAIDRLPEPADPYRARGSLVHAVLEELFRLPPVDRTPEAAERLLREVWDACRAEEILAGLDLPGDAEAAWLTTAETMLRNAFLLEDPGAVAVEDVEVKVAHTTEHTALRGIVDRIEHHPDGGWILADYKTGRSPSDTYALGAFFGLQFYALICWRAFGELPRELRLFQLGVPEVLTLRPTPEMLEGLERKLDALGAAVLRAIRTGDWRPRPSTLCTRCPHRSLCPAWSTAEAPAASAAPKPAALSDVRIGAALLVDGGGRAVAGVDGEVAQREDPAPDGLQLRLAIPAGEVGAPDGAEEQGVA